MSDLDRSTRSMSLLTIASRLSGFVRIAVFASVFGKTYLANTYQSANSIPNVLFELFAAGALQAVLVPAMTRLGTVSAPTTHPTSPDTVAGRRDDTTSLRPYGHTDHGLAPDEYVAGAVLGLLSALLAAVTVGAIAAGPQLMGLLVGDVPDAATRQAEIELGAIFLWFFMPQVLFYGANIVATSVLNAKNSFLVPVAAPLANNVIVVIAYLWFGAVHEGPLTLDLTSQELWILAGGTTLGVIVFCSLPLVALARRGFRLRPRIDLGHPVIRSLVRDGAWAALFLGATQILLLVVLRVANRDPGGTVIYSFAFVLFMLPHSLFSVPIMTTRFPALSRSSVLNDSASFASTTRGGIRAILYTSLFASALSIAVARPATEVVSFGEAVSLSAQIAEATSFFAPGILGFGLLLFLTRVYYARSDARTPALTNFAVVVVTSAVMLSAVTQLGPRHLISGLAAAFAVGHLGGALLLFVGMSRGLAEWGAPPLSVGRDAARAVAASVAAATAGFAVASAVGWSNRPIAVISTLAAAVVAASVYIAVQAVAGGPRPIDALRTFGAATRADPTGAT